MTKTMEFLKRQAVRALRGAEKYTRTDMVYMATNGSWLGIKTVLAAFLALGVSVAFANLLPVHVYGEYKYVLSVLGILSLTTLPGLGTSVVRSIAKGFDGTPHAVLVTKIRWGFLGALGSAGLAAYYWYAGNLTLAGAFLVSAVFLPYVDTLSMFATILSGKKLFRVSILYEIGVQLVGAIAVVATLLVTDSLMYVLLAYFSAYTLARFVALRIASARYLTNTSVDTGALPYGLHLSAMEVLATIAESVNSLLLWFFIGPSQLAMYAFAKAIPTQILGGLKKLSVIALPKFATRDLADIKETLLRRLMWLWVGLFVLFIAYVLAAPYIFHTLFPKYVDAIFYTELIALSFLLFPKKIIGTVLNAHMRTKELYLNSILTPCVQLVLAVILTPTYGITGAIISELSAQAFSLVLVTVLLFRTTHVSR
ncbi:MAG: oligosaccharide flippase family protein [Candidatus Pacebacteria bacterium]|nr:oligosaccharide flippase family protein [Candidatus Paceibacterota bacterium]